MNVRGSAHVRAFYARIHGDVSNSARARAGAYVSQRAVVAEMCLWAARFDSGGRSISIIPIRRGSLRIFLGNMLGKGAAATAATMTLAPLITVAPAAIVTRSYDDHSVSVSVARLIACVRESVCARASKKKQQQQQQRA